MISVCLEIPAVQTMKKDEKAAFGSDDGLFRLGRVTMEEEVDVGCRLNYNLLVFCLSVRSLQ